MAYLLLIYLTKKKNTRCPDRCPMWETEVAIRRLLYRNKSVWCFNNTGASVQNFGRPAGRRIRDRFYFTPFSTLIAIIFHNCRKAGELFFRILSFICLFYSYCISLAPRFINANLIWFLNAFISILAGLFCRSFYNDDKAHRGLLLLWGWRS